MADQLGMSVDELRMKKQMLMDQGLWGEEITKALSMGGGASSLFKDDVESNVQAPQSIDELIFFSSVKEKDFAIKELIGEKHLVLVFTRGYYGGAVCPFCVTQTAELAAKKEEFEKRDAAVLIIYPGSEEHLPDFAAAVTQTDREKADIEAVGWPVLLDRDLSAVNLLDIAADLASPSTFIIDKRGNVVFAYVGANRTDRPSVGAVLSRLDALQPTGG
ncbi:MAG: redoxin domain-containing protein [Planctomycetota bacterium]